MKREKPEWYKVKGYPHFSAAIPVGSKAQRKLIAQIENPEYVAKHSFYPLLHVVMKERKYKKHPDIPDKRTHSYKKNGEYKKTVKVRPIHYANHKDALIFGYYALLLAERYENILQKEIGLSECITAYRKVPINGNQKNKGAIHFANEAFQEIRQRTLNNGTSAVLAFDIKNFFPSLDHGFLKEKWKEVMNCETLEQDHENVLKAATKYSFIYRDDLRVFKHRNGRRGDFNEKQFAVIRNTYGIYAFFEHPRMFREIVKSGKLRIYPNLGKNKDTGEMIGIPQGLPISAVLANMYLLDFDRNILHDLVTKKDCFYRRYSDDIVIICSFEDIDYVKEYVENEMKKSRVEISTEKTEQFIFKNESDKVQVYKLKDNQELKDRPFGYLGFEFYGYKTLIKSANLSKFYRRMIYSIKKKCQRAKTLSEQTGSDKTILFKRQLYKLYRNIDLDKEYSIKKHKRYELQDTGQYRLISSTKKEAFKSNYFSYVKRASEIMDEPKIANQTKSERKIFNEAIQRHLK